MFLNQPPHQTTVKMPLRVSSKHHISYFVHGADNSVIHCPKHFNVHVHSSIPHLKMALLR